MSLTKSTPVELRQGLEAAHTLAKVGLEFVPIPVVKGNRAELKKQLEAALCELQAQAESDMINPEDLK